MRASTRGAISLSAEHAWDAAAPILYPLLRAAGTSYRALEDDDGVLLPVIEAHCEYRQPARYDDELLIRAQGEMASPVRIRFTYEVVRVADGAELARGHTVHASTDLAGRPKRLPAHVRAFFA